MTRHQVVGDGSQLADRYRQVRADPALDLPFRRAGAREAYACSIVSGM